MLPENIIYLGIFANIVLSIWYIKSIIYDTTKPNLVSWVIWTLAPLTGFFLQIKAGAGMAASGVFFAGFFPLFTIIVCLVRKNSYWKISFFDVVCGALAIIALILYVLTNNLTISIIFAVSSDALAYLPTIKKTWSFPESESASTYLGGFIANIFALLIITNWDFNIYFFPAYLVCSNLMVVLCIYRKKFFRSDII